MSWYTRGTRPERNVEAALINGLYGLLGALAKRKLELIRSPGQLVKDYALSDSIAQAS